MPASSIAGLAASAASARAPPSAIATTLGRASATTMALRWPSWRPAAIGTLALGHAVHRPRLLHLLPRSDGIAFLQQAGESRARGLCDLVLKLLGKVRERDVRMDRLHVAQKLVRQAAGCALQRRDGVDDRREDDRLHDVIGSFLHSISSLSGGLGACRSLSPRRT